MAKEPGYRLHKSSGQAIVRLGGRMFYLGPFGSDESKTKYAQLKSEWLVSQNAEKFVQEPDGPTIATVCLAFLDHAEIYYGDGKELEALKAAIKPLAALYATLPAKQFGPLEFKAVRQWWLSKECNTVNGRCTRTYINSQMKRLTRLVKWSVGEAMIPPAVHEAIKCVLPLKQGRSSAPEAPPVKCVAKCVVESTIPHLPPIVADMVRVQLLLGCRPGEVCAITPAMFDRSESVWKITLPKHKNAYRGQTRTLYAGPQAQAILAKYLLRGADDCLFRPCDTVSKQLAERSEARITPEGYGNPCGRRHCVGPLRASSRGPHHSLLARAVSRNLTDEVFSPDEAFFWPHPQPVHHQDTDSGRISSIA